jgi:4-hydroxybenzoyl-CoA thioesterase
MAGGVDWIWTLALALPFDWMHMDRRFGIPIVHTQCELLKPCRIGERLVLELSVARIGCASLDLSLRPHRGRGVPARATSVR